MQNYSRVRPRVRSTMNHRRYLRFEQNHARITILLRLLRTSLLDIPFVSFKIQARRFYCPARIEYPERPKNGRERKRAAQSDLRLARFIKNSFCFVWILESKSIWSALFMNSAYTEFETHSSHWPLMTWKLNPNICFEIVSRYNVLWVFLFFFLKYLRSILL